MPGNFTIIEGLIYVNNNCMREKTCTFIKINDVETLEVGPYFISTDMTDRHRRVLDLL